MLPLVSHWRPVVIELPGWWWPNVTNTSFTRYNRLSNRFDNRFWQPVEQTAVRSTLLSNRVWQPVERTVAVRSTGLSNRLSKPVVKPVWQPVVSCKRGLIKRQPDVGRCNVIYARLKLSKCYLLNPELCIQGRDAKPGLWKHRFATFHGQ